MNQPHIEGCLAFTIILDATSVVRVLELKELPQGRKFFRHRTFTRSSGGRQWDCVRTLVEKGRLSRH